MKKLMYAIVTLLTLLTSFTFSKVKVCASSPEISRYEAYLIEAEDLKTQPYASAENVKDLLSAGEKVEVLKIVKNDYGNTWAKVKWNENTGYIYYENLRRENYEAIQLEVPYFSQKQKNDCGISSIAMIEAYEGEKGLIDFDNLYQSVLIANNNSLSISTACNEGKYIDIDATLESFYNQLKEGHPVLIYRTPNNHWSVITGYNGCSDHLERSGFLVWNTCSGVDSCEWYKAGDSNVKVLDLKTWLGSSKIKRARVMGTGIFPDVCPVFSSTTAVDITSTAAKIQANFSKLIYDDVGFYLAKGDSIKNVSIMKKSEGAGVVKCFGVSYKLGTNKWTEPLNPNCRYYYCFYLVYNGETYLSDWKSFKTTE